ncbi:MAG: response regulator [Chitinophagaceae bacterium]
MNSIHILLIEDNAGDILLTTEALQQGKLINRLSVVTNGDEAIDFLTKQGNYANAGLPDLILLDINLPRKNGHEVLQYIKESRELKHIPVIMLTTSSSESDIASSYQHSANCYISKPVDVNAFMDAIAKLGDFWINIVTLPKSHQSA